MKQRGQFIDRRWSHPRFRHGGVGGGSDGWGYDVRKINHLIRLRCHLPIRIVKLLIVWLLHWRGVRYECL